MPEEVEKIEKADKKKISIMRRLMKYFRNLLILLVLFTITIMVLVQQSSFRTWAIEKILDLASSELEAQIEIKDINFSSFHSIEIDNVIIITQGDTLANIPKLNLDFNPNKLTQNLAEVYQLNIYNPKIKIIRNKAGEWNVDHIAKPSTDTSTKPPSKFVIDLKNLLIRNADFTLIDSTQDQTIGKSINYSNMRLLGLNISLDALVKLYNPEIYAQIKNLSAWEAHTGTSIKEFNSTSSIIPGKISSYNTKFEVNGSKVEMNAELSNFDILGKGGNTDIANAKILLYLNADKMKQENISRFANIGDIIKSDIDINLVVKGTFDNMIFERAKLSFENTKLNFSGNLDNLSGKKPLYYEVKFKKSYIKQSDISKLLPSIDLKSIPNLHYVEIEELKAHGGVDTLTSELNLKTASASINGLLDLGFAKELNYKANLNTINLNLAEILKDSTKSSNINSNIVVSGSGTSLEKLNTDLKIYGTNSNIGKLDLSSIKIDIDVHNSLINIDTLQIDFEDKEHYLDLIGKLDFINPKDPKYNLKLSFDQFNISKLITNKILPNQAGGRIKINGHGFDIATLSMDLESELDYLTFKDRTFVPIQIHAHFNQENLENKIIKIESDFADLDIVGKFNFVDVINSIAFHSESFVSFVNDKINIVVPSSELNKDTLPIYHSNKKKMLQNLDCQITGKVKDISIVSMIEPKIKIAGKAALGFKIKTNDSLSIIGIDSLNVNSFFFEDHNVSMKLNEIALSGNFILDIQDTLASYSRFAFYTRSQSEQRINTLQIQHPDLILAYLDNDIKFYAKSGMANIVDFYITGNANINNGLNFNIDTLAVDLAKKYTWVSKEAIALDFNKNGFNVKKLLLNRISGEDISVDGDFDAATMSAKNLNLTMTRIDLEPVLEFLPANTKKTFSSLKGTVDKLNVNLNGKIAQPEIKIDIDGSNFSFNNYLLGDLHAKFIHRDSVIKGELGIFHPKMKNSEITVKMISFPLNLSISDMKLKNRFHGAEKMDARFEAKNVAMKAIEPFLPAVSDFTGYGNAYIDFSGVLPDKLDYNGKANFKDISFLTDATNIRYIGEGALDISYGRIDLDNIIVRNTKTDYAKGKAEVSGYIKNTAFSIDSLNIFAKTKDLLVLNDGSKRTFPDLYGECRIATGIEPIHFFGTLNEPNLYGDVNILKADLKMPQEEIRKVVASQLKYEIKSDVLEKRKRKLEFENKRKNDSLYEESANIEQSENTFVPEVSFKDLINYNMNIRFPGIFRLDMDINSVINVKAEIGLDDNSKPLHFEKSRKENEPKLTGGTLVLKDNSEVNFFYKKFRTKGKLQFSTGAVYNPNVELEAYREGKTSGDSPQEYLVKLFVNGTKEKPIIFYMYSLDGQFQTGDQTKIFENISYLLLLGTLKTNKQQAGLTNVSIDFGNQIVSNTVTQELNRAIASYGIYANIQDVLNFDKAKLEIKGQLFNKYTWTYGGSVKDFTSYNQLMLEVPIYDNLILQTNYLNSNTSVISPDQKKYEVKVRYKKSW